MPKSAKDSYHHGDLRSACLEAARDLLAKGSEAELSLRAVARGAGVSANAPYRHFSDKDALLAALATQGFLDLRQALLSADSSAGSGQEIVAMAQAYVRYAIDNPGLFHLMFGHPCIRSHPEAQAAAHETYEVLGARVTKAIAPKQRAAFMAGCWALVHGLASLILDGKLSAVRPQDIDAFVKAAVAATLEPPRKK